MKTAIFLNAIRSRNNLKFLYGLTEIYLEPYYVTTEGTGKKVIYGRVKRTNEIRKFRYEKIANIRVLNNYRFSPIIPTIQQAS